jgi:hypothetical protein
MGAPINHFEIVESIRFFGQIVSTEGIDENAKKIANEYIVKLLKALGSSVDQTTAKSAGIQILGDKT